MQPFVNEFLKPDSRPVAQVCDKVQRNMPAVAFCPIGPGMSDDILYPCVIIVDGLSVRQKINALVTYIHKEVGG